MSELQQARARSRAEQDLITERLDVTLDPETFTPRLLALLSNALVWRESTELRRRFGLGTNDWRVISALALRPGAPATEICEFTGVNKAAVSKSVTTLASRGLVALLDGPRGSRPMYLTPDGAVMHHLMYPISMKGQEIILADLAPDDIDQLNQLLQRMLEKTKSLQVLENGASISDEDEDEDDGVQA
ncbi:MarR family winged helix-turn-helix transcriptional regulator [Pseudolysinimonas sp.]|uniref:MarR family winged helix-turn-helix transcriptional regulator n=1 Tax=Pseudolysinimonas sp. TaxID=2680009 RepID=UPI00286BBA95|nr:MarR family winged helix-turn-helix transcriptional regulator [Pseudolysinimonas sp.]